MNNTLKILIGVILGFIIAFFVISFLEMNLTWILEPKNGYLRCLFLTNWAFSSFLIIYGKNIWGIK